MSKVTTEEILSAFEHSASPAADSREAVPAADDQRWAYRLVGHDLDEGWHVDRLFDSDCERSGGLHSACYEVSRGGERGFLKALDYSRALSCPPAEQVAQMQMLLQAFRLEGELYDVCRRRRLDRVITAHTTGYVKISDTPFVGTVHYIILERGEPDLRELVGLADEAAVAAQLRHLHNLSTGVRQLHQEGIAHQDIKISNSVRVEGVAKLSDFGSASKRGVAHPYDASAIRGDHNYAPLECLYRFELPNWEDRRLGGDLYLFGGMLAFLLTGAQITGGVYARLRDEHRWSRWKGSFEDVVPFLQAAFSQVLNEFVEPYMPPGCEELTRAVAQLCEPDPFRRGFVLGPSPGQTRFDLQRLESRLNHLATLAARGLLKTKT